MAPDKALTDQVEDIELENAKILGAEQTPLPASLERLSEDELRSLNRKTTLKLDLVVMPALTIMYILNYLGEYS